MSGQIVTRLGRCRRNHGDLIAVTGVDGHHMGPALAVLHERWDRSGPHDPTGVAAADSFAAMPERVACQSRRAQAVALSASNSRDSGERSVRSSTRRHCRAHSPGSEWPTHSAARLYQWAASSSRSARSR